jgi:hypothetical protein
MKNSNIHNNFDRAFSGIATKEYRRLISAGFTLKLVAREHRATPEAGDCEREVERRPPVS